MKKQKEYEDEEKDQIKIFTDKSLLMNFGCYQWRNLIKNFRGAKLYLLYINYYF